MEMICILVLFMFLMFSTLNSHLIIENLVLRQQLTVMKQSVKRPKIRIRDRIFWVFLSCLWKHWQDVLIVVKPETVIRWHKKGFKLFWRYKSGKRGPGRLPVDPEIRKIIENMAKENLLWGAPRIHGELMKLGIDNISERTISNIIRKYRTKPPSQTWRTFLHNHMHNTFSIDLFTVPTVTFKILFVCVIIWHKRRNVVHFNVTMNPTVEWTAQQVVEACPWNTVPNYLLRDRDKIYGGFFQKRINHMGINEVITAPQSPWQSPFVERLIGSIRRDCLDHVIVLNKKHLKRILTEYLSYYHHDRTHLGLLKDTPNHRSIQARIEKMQN